jgi:Ni/Fe-hydrogenase b-type cytochrome subunit
MSDLVYRHNRVTRATHWVNAVALTVLFMSGLMIFNAYPHLHWGSKAEPEEAFFSIYASDDTGELRAYTELYGRRVETTGVLGTQNTAMGPTARAFPSWITIPGFYWLAGGRRWHFFFAWLFVLNGIFYFIYNRANGHMAKFTLLPRDVPKLLPMALYYLHLRQTSPQDGEYNPLQKLAYTSVFFILTPLVMVTGLAMSPQIGVAFNWLPALFGGRQSARSFHFIMAFAFAFFTLGHVMMVVTTGAFNNMRSMVSGWYREKFHGAEAPAPDLPAAVESAPEPAATASETEAPAPGEEERGGDEKERP